MDALGVEPAPERLVDDSGQVRFGVFDGPIADPCLAGATLRQGAFRLPRFLALPGVADAELQGGALPIVKVLLDNTDTLLPFPEMKGARGMIGIPQWTTWTWVFLSFMFVVIVMRNLLHSSVGRTILAVREDERAAELVGIDVANAKILAFVVGSIFAGLAGGIRAHDLAFLHPQSFNFVQSFNPLIIVVLGGLGSMTGTILTGFLWIFLLEGFLRLYLPPGFETWRLVVYPLILLIMMLLRPEGLFGQYEVPFLRQTLPAMRKGASQTAEQSVEEVAA